MARKEKVKVDTIIKPGAVARTDLPANLLRELVEITRNSGREIDLSLPQEELEAICNQANNPPDSWRNRWTE